MAKPLKTKKPTMTSVPASPVASVAVPKGSKRGAQPQTPTGRDAALAAKVKEGRKDAPPDGAVAATGGVAQPLLSTAGTPGVGSVLQAGVQELMNAMMYVDPSRLFSNNLFTAYNPERLVSRKGLKIFDDMKRDEQVKAALKFKKDTMLSSGWEIVSPEGKPEDWEVTKFVRDQFLNIKGGLNKSLRKILLSLDYGYSVTEKIYQPIEDGPYKGKIGLVKLNSVKPHYIDFVTNPTGEIMSVLQRSLHSGGLSGMGLATGGPTLADRANASSMPLFPPAKFVIHTYTEEFENPYGTSDLVAAYRPWWIKENVYKWLAIYLERYGMPPLIALYNSSTYQGNQLVELQKFMKNIQNATLGLIPRLNKEDIELWSQELGTSSQANFIAALERYDADIAKALLVPGLVGMTSDGNTGSNARAGVHFDSFVLVTQDLQEDVAGNAINDQVIPQLVDLNYSGVAQYPVFKFLPFKDETRLKVLELWTNMVTAKIVNRIEDDETHIRRTLGMPENDNPKLEPLPSDAQLQADKTALAQAPKTGGLGLKPVKAGKPGGKNQTSINAPGKGKRGQARYVSDAQFERFLATFDEPDFDLEDELVEEE